MNVYFARAAFKAKIGRQTAGFVHWQIGRAFNVERRKAALQAASPIPIEIIGVLDCESKQNAIAIERELRDYFSDAKVGDRWLSLSPRQTMIVHHLIEQWPKVSSIASFLNGLPKRIECEAKILRVDAEFVPHAALHEARLQIKQLRNQMAEAQEKVRLSALTYKQVFDSAIEHLTAKYNQAIQSLQFRALH
jgi:Meiotically Up-regulated Gene 113 (MUG113) protein